jgi:small-conductance mechanosensitive channel
MDPSIKRILIPTAIALGSVLVLLIARAVAIRVLHKWAEKTETLLDDAILHAFRTPSIYLAIGIGLQIGIDLSELPEKQISLINKIIHIIIVLSVTLATSNLAGNLFKGYVQRSNLPIPTTGLASGILRGTILMIGFLIMLNIMGISIAPLLTALGVGGLAVALALQDTLANLFSGIHILVERSVRVGDFIRLETGQEGFVDDISWRTTRIRMASNNLVVIPNSKLSQSVVTNYSLPEKQLALQIPVGVSYDSDIDAVEQTLLEIAQKAIGDLPGLLASPAPQVRFIPGFGESSLDLTLVVQVREFADQVPVQHELRKRIFKTFKAKGIEIPYPHRTVYVKREQS